MYVQYYRKESIELGTEQHTRDALLHAHATSVYPQRASDTIGAGYERASLHKHITYMVASSTYQYIWYNLLCSVTVEESTRMYVGIRNTHSLTGITKSEQITASVRFDNDDA